MSHFTGMKSQDNELSLRILVLNLHSDLLGSESVLKEKWFTGFPSQNAQ